MKNLLKLIFFLVIMTNFQSCLLDKKGEFNDGMASIQDFASGKFGYIDTDNNIVIEKKFDWAGNFNSNFAIVEKNKKRGLIDKQGNIVIPIIHQNITLLDNNFFEISDGNKVGVYNSNNEEIIPTVAVDIVKLHQNKYFEVLLKKDGQNYLTIFDLNGNQILETIDNKAIKIINNYLVSERDWGNSNEHDYKIYDLKNKANRINKFNYVNDIKVLETKKGIFFQLNSKGFNSKVSVINEFGKVVIPKGKYSHIWDFNENIFVVQVTGQGAGYADLDGNLFLKPIFNNAKPFQDGIAKVTLNEKTFFINKHGACFKDCPTKKWFEFHKIPNFKVNNSKLNSLLEKGKKQSLRENYRESLVSFSQAISENPLNYEAYKSRGLSYYFMGESLNAEKDVKKAISLNPTCADCHFILGNIYEKYVTPVDFNELTRSAKNHTLSSIDLLNGKKDYTEQYNKALTEFINATQIDKNHSDAYLKCAVLSGKLGKNKDACFYLYRACELENKEACSGYSKFCKQK